MLEDLAAKGLARTRLAKSAHDAGWSSFMTMLEHKARFHGRQFHRIGRFIGISAQSGRSGSQGSVA